MSSAKQSIHDQDRERILAELVRREAGVPTESLTAAEESTIRDIGARLDTIAETLRQVPPLNDFAEESECRRAAEFVKSLADRPEFSNADHLIDHIGPYQLGPQLGQGGMGTVYKAIHAKLKRVVAVKILAARRTKSVDAIARFEREMEAIGALHHPNIVTAHDAAEIDGMQYLVMEYVDGVDLSTLTRRVGPLLVANACEIIRQAAGGLAEAHRTGIVHRDIKPSNIMLAAPAHTNAEPAVKLLDFGLALLAPEGEAETELTAAGQIMGTLNYMSPEQASQSHTVDARADVYSLGATLYRLLSGEPPFADKSGSPWALVTALATEEPTPLSSLRADLPPRLVAIVNSMMAKNPEDRYASADEVVQALAPWGRGARLGELLEQARDNQTDVEDRVASSRVKSVAQTASATRSNRPPRSWLWLAGFLLAIAGAVVFWNLIQTVPTDTAFVPDRAAAEWLALHNARFGVTVVDEGFQEIIGGDTLPTEAFHLDTIDLSNDKLVRDQDLAKIHHLSRLAALGLNYTLIGDEGLARLSDLPRLRSLFLVETRVTDLGLAELSRFAALDTLYLSKAPITDAGLAHVGALTSLNELSLMGCHVSDSGLQHLQPLTNLRVLFLQDTNVTARGIAELQLALPSCSIQSDFTDEEIRNASHEIAKSANR